MASGWLSRAGATSELAQSEAARETALEAMSLYRHLAKQRPESSEVPLVWALHGLGRRERNLGRLAEAADAASEAMAILAPRARQLVPVEADGLERVLGDYLEAVRWAERAPRVEWVESVASALDLDVGEI